MRPHNPNHGFRSHQSVPHMVQYNNEPPLMANISKNQRPQLAMAKSENQPPSETNSSVTPHHNIRKGTL